MYHFKNVYRPHAYYVPGAILIILHALTHLILTTTYE